MNKNKYSKKRGDRRIKNKEDPRVKLKRSQKKRNKEGSQRIKVKLIKKDEKKKSKNLKAVRESRRKDGLRKRRK
jgi:hypothetical protein